jgi:hypothetical protein
MRWGRVVIMHVWAGGEEGRGMSSAARFVLLVAASWAITSLLVALIDRILGMV